MLINLQLAEILKHSKSYHSNLFMTSKSDLAYYYKQSIDGIEESKREAWRIYHHHNNNNEVSVKEKLSALKLIIESNEARFKLLSEGPSVLAIKSLEERLNKIEIAGQISQ